VTAPRGARPLVLALGVLLAAAGPTGAHPHVFVEHSMVVVAGPKGIEAIQLLWTFDALFSAMVVQTFDADRDGTFSAAEVQAIEQKHFANIRRYNYFVDIKRDGRSLPISVRDFRARIPKDQVVYAFTVPVSPNGGEGRLEITVDDPTYYTAFTAARPAVKVQAHRDYRVDCALEARGDLVPEAVVCTSRKAGR
jgi:ABC-type uncharacterized transport system substrate-binding protein